MPKVPHLYEVNWHLVTGNGSLTQMCSLLKCSLTTSLTVSIKGAALLTISRVVSTLLAVFPCTCNDKNAILLN